MIDETWLAVGFAAILIPALVYGHRLHRQVIRDMFDDDADEMAGASSKMPPADSQRKSSAGEP